MIQHIETNARLEECERFQVALNSGVIPVWIGHDPGTLRRFVSELKYFIPKEQYRQLVFFPYTDFNPYPQTGRLSKDAMSELIALTRLHFAGDVKGIITHSENLARKWLSADKLEPYIGLYTPGEELERQSIIEQLLGGGYVRVDRCEEPGSFSVRGSLIDIYWPGETTVQRLDFFGDELEQIRQFHPSNPHETTRVESAFFGPVRLPLGIHELAPEQVQAIRDRADIQEIPTKKISELIENIRSPYLSTHLDALIPTFHELTDSFLDLLPANDRSMIFSDLGATSHILKKQRDRLATDYEEAVHGFRLVNPPIDFIDPQLDIEKLRLSTSDCDFGSIRTPLSLQSLKGQNISPILELRQDILTRERHAEDLISIYAPLKEVIRSAKKFDKPAWIVTNSKSVLERLQFIFSELALSARLVDARLRPMFCDLPDSLIRDHGSAAIHAFIQLVDDPPENTGSVGEPTFTVLPATYIFGQHKRRIASNRTRQKAFTTTLSDLTPGDAIVHIDHGVGRYKELTRLNIHGIDEDYLFLEYKDGDKLYLPVHRINLIQKYQGGTGHPPQLDKLGSNKWKSTKAKVKKAIESMAADLLRLYGKRALAKRPAYPEPGLLYHRFEDDFPFTPTEDQEKAFESIIGDLSREQPMDRLICGDVGFGKTEVAMRAAMHAVESGKQVAILAPTTVLAQQHFLNFSKRFKNVPVEIEVASRFQKTTKVKDTLSKVKEGQVDILIGTHRLLSSDVSFQKLGLLVVDEEQRFGVKAKEHINRLKNETDVLTLSATPIPRTLQMSFLGIRDLSLIETPPIDRKSIATELIAFEESVVREAIERERQRGGQIFFIHNRVRSIYARAEYLQRIVPGLKIGIGHGQMTEKELEAVMLSFINGEIDMLLATTIVENGIDVPNANTIIIDHASDFGLSQLYQLRGRVGRSDKKAFAYLVAPRHLETLETDARQRLETLKRFSELGSGFKIAQRDLEIRGAGDLLGKNQSGHATAVGYDLYARMLKETVEHLRGQDNDSLFDPDVKFPVSAHIPSDVVKEVSERLAWYQRFATVETPHEVYDILQDFEERYAADLPELRAFAQLMHIKCSSRRLRASLVHVSHDPEQVATPPVFTLTLDDSTPIKLESLLARAQQEPDKLRLIPPNRLQIKPPSSIWTKSGMRYAQCFDAAVKEYL